MKIWKAYNVGLKFTFGHKRMWGGLYIFLLLFALIIASPFHSFLESSVGYNLDLDRHTHIFNYTFIFDYLADYGDGIMMLLEQLKWLLFMFFFLSVYTTSAIVSIIRSAKKEFRFSDFFKGGVKYFWRYFRLSLYSFIFLALVFGVILKVFEWTAGGLSVFDIENDIVMIKMFNVLLPVYFLIVFGTFLIFDLSKIDVAYNKEKWLFNNIRRSVHLVFSQALNYWGLYGIIFLSYLLLFALHHIVKTIASQAGYAMVIFALGQLFILARIGIKLLNLSSLNYIYKQNLNGQDSI